MLVPNMVIADAAGVRRRILWVHEKEGICWTFSLSDPKALPEHLLVGKIESMLVECQMRIVPIDESFADLCLALTPAAKRLRDQALEVIETLVREEPDIYEPDKRARLVRMACDVFKVSRQVVYKWLRRWWSGGCVANALVPGFARCGAPGKARVDDGSYKPVGRRRVHVPGDNLNLSACHRMNIDIAVRSRYLKSHAGSLESAYRWMLTNCYREYVTLLPDGAGVKVCIHTPGKVPTIGQFGYHAQQVLSAHDKLVRKLGKSFELKHRMLLSDSNAQVKGPGARYQIDATIVDVYLLSARVRNRILGRPTLYIVIDVFSGAIVGYYLGLESPCWIGALMALLNTLEDKEALCARFDVPLPEGAWPMRGFPRVLLGDGGEVAMRSAERLAQNFAIEIETAPPYRGDAKGLVEGSFRTIQAPFGEYVPGYVEKPDYAKRAGNDYRLDAVLTLRDLNRIILSLIIERNLKPRRSHPEEVAIVSSGEPLSPVAIWNWGVRNLKKETREVPLQYAEALLLPRKSATVSRRGVSPFRGLYYISDELLAADWFQSAVLNSTRVEFAYDPRCMDRGYVFPPAAVKSATPLVVQITRHSRRFGDDALADVMAIGRGVAENNAAACIATLETQVAGDLLRKEIITHAKAEVKRQQDPSLSKRERVAGIRQARAEEKAEMRPDSPLFNANLNASTDSVVPCVPHPVAEPDDAADTLLDEVSRLFGED